uniref:hypothetical protein n=1 Tax=Marivita sp. TaxID=2003365 RepID=UPI002625C305
HARTLRTQTTKTASNPDRCLDQSTKTNRRNPSLNSKGHCLKVVDTFRQARGIPTFPTLPTDGQAKDRKVGSVGTVGRIYAVDPEIIHEEIAPDIFEERGASPLLKVSQPAMVENAKPGTANVGSSAMLGAQLIDAQYQKTVGGRVATWTGRIVSLDEWRSLTTWQRHGPDGRYWCVISREWRTPK